jgi:hypothetical protein
VRERCANGKLAEKADMLHEIEGEKIREAGHRVHHVNEEGLRKRARNAL